MDGTESPPRYGVKRQRTATAPQDVAAEAIDLHGWTVLPPRHTAAELADLRRRFDAARAEQARTHGRDRLATMGEDSFLRLPLAVDDAFLALAADPCVLGVMERVFDGYFILMLQNGIFNPPGEAGRYIASWHRDLPYQHFVTSRPIAVNAMFCIDDFSADTGGTVILPSSQRREAMPSDALVERTAIQVGAPAGSVILFDAMMYHRAGANHSDRPRRGVNMVYSLAFLKQQFVIPEVLGDRFRDRPDLRQLLGYDSNPPRSIYEWYASRDARFGTHPPPTQEPVE